MHFPETLVEKFYSTGSKKRQCEYTRRQQYDEGFLSFGYWEKETRTYLDAARNLLDYFMDNSGIGHAPSILNVACGYGAETFPYYFRFKPSVIEGIDITRVHVDYANSRARAMNLENRIKFRHGDACVLDYPDNHFSNILGIEGPAHFRIRERFFKAAHRVLQPGGEMLLTDIVMRRSPNPWRIIQRGIMRLTAKKWVVPKENMVGEAQYCAQLKQANFEIVFFKNIGAKVFPGYARDGFRFRTLRTRLSQRGFWATLGLTIISYFLGYLYRKELIDYVYVKARKPL